MRAAIARQGAIVVDEIPDPTPGPGEVLVKTLACGICGSDLHALKHIEHAAQAARRSGSFFQLDPKKEFVLGHEFCAEVVDYGPMTERRLKPGTLVCSEPVVAGPTGLVPVGFSNDVPGGYAQYMRLMEGLLVEVPSGLSPALAALTEPIAVGVHAVGRARLGKRDSAVVVGCGPVGLAVIGALKAADVRPIVAVDFSRARRQLALRLGADVVVDPRESSPYASFREVALAEPGNAAIRPLWMPGPALKRQAIFECVGVPGLIQQVMEGAEPGAQIVVVGVCMEPDTFEPMFAINKELDFKFTFGHSPEEFEAALHQIAEGTIDADALLTGVTGLGGVAAAFEDLAGADTHAKIVIDPWRTGGLERS
jgi:threonine dehydrogenase-like Zn-dependent dehydrogenase